MRLVHHNARVLIQVPAGEGLPQQHAISHILDHGVLRGAVLKADGVAHLRKVGTVVEKCGAGIIRENGDISDILIMVCSKMQSAIRVT